MLYPDLEQTDRIGVRGLEYVFRKHLDVFIVVVDENGCVFLLDISYHLDDFK